MSKTPDANPRKVLGKGLSALLPQRPQGVPQKEVEAPPKSSHSKLDATRVPIGLISPNTAQPREEFDDQKLDELAQSIRTNGIIQPITVLAASEGKFTIIAGERRWRAAQIAGLTEIPVFVRDATQDQILELALIENIQREDLNAVETATAFRRLQQEYKLSHEQIAERTGKDRSTITNFVRLLRLSKPVLADLAGGRISVGHARTLLNLTDVDQQNDICQQIIEQGLSVRETEALVKRILQPIAEPAKTEPAAEKKIDPNVRAAVEQIASFLGTRVRLIPKNEKSGKIEIEYYNPDDLDRIYSLIMTPEDKNGKVSGAGGRS